jgi:hypothetical protein
MSATTPITEEPKPKLIYTAKVIKIENGKAVIGVFKKEIKKVSGQ